MKYEKPISEEDLYIGCLHCSTACLVAPMSMIIAVGLGDACVTVDGHRIYDESWVKDEQYWTVLDAEMLAANYPNRDWRIIKYGPMHGETFQRQGKRNWVCIESNRGFA